MKECENITNKTLEKRIVHVVVFGVNQIKVKAVDYIVLGAGV